MREGSQTNSLRVLDSDTVPRGFIVQELPHTLTPGPPALYDPARWKDSPT
jgi:hypothetical protein